MNPKAKYSPGVISLIPLFYVGWADDELNAKERKLIQKKINDLPFLNDSDKKLLKTWNDAEKPPTDGQFKEWAQILSAFAHHIKPKKKISLADMGLEMAKVSCEGDDEVFCQETTQHAISDIEEAIGASDLSFFRSIIPNIAHEPQDAPQNFDPIALQSVLEGDYAEFHNEVKDLLCSSEFSRPLMRVKLEHRNQVLKWCKALGSKGFGGLSFPTEYGGEGSIRKYGIVFALLAYHDISLAIKFGVQFGLWGGSVANLGTKYHHDKYLPQTGSAELLGCFAMTETGHGSNVNGVETTATYLPDTNEIEVHSPNFASGKEYIGNALHSMFASVFCQLIVKGENQGVHAVVVQLRDNDGNLKAGVSVADNGYKLGLNGVDNGRLWFNHVRIPRENLLNKYGNIDSEGQYTSPIVNPNKRFFTMLGTLVGGRVFVPQCGLAAAKKGLTIAIKYALKRRQFAAKDGELETLLLDYPSHQKRLLPLLAKAYAHHFALEYLTERYVNKTESDSREIETLAAAIKSKATWFTSTCLQECREACGGKGYLAENELADLKADTEIFTTFEGDNTVLMQLVGKGLLSNFKKEFHDEGFKAVMKMISSNILDTLTEVNPIFKRNTDVKHLTSKAFFKDALAYRERRLLISLTQRMRKLLKRRIDPYAAFLRCQNHLLQLSHAYADHLILKQFYRKIKQVEAPEVKIALEKLYQLSALTTIYENAGWYLESDYMDGSKSKAIRKLIARLNREIRPDALAYVDAFGIPEKLLVAPIVVDN